MPSLVTLLSRSKSENANRPGQVRTLHGVIFQSDGKSTIGRVFIRPLEAIDRWIAGVMPSRSRPPLAMHAGLHVELDDGRHYVAEQLVGTLFMDFVSGLNWTPLSDFQGRDRGGWDVTVPATAFRGVDDTAVQQCVKHLNSIGGHPFLGEDCTAFIERAFGGKRMFADSPLLRSLGMGARVGDPALPLLKPDSKLDPRAEELLHSDAVRTLPDAMADPESLNVRAIIPKIAIAGSVGAAAGMILGRARAR